MTAALSLFVTVAAQQPQQEGGMLQHHNNDCIVEMRENVLFCFIVGWGMGVEKVLFFSNSFPLTIRY